MGDYLCMRQRASANVLVEYFAPELNGFGNGTGTTKHSQIHHGLADLIVPFSQNADDANRVLTRECVSVEMWSYAGAGHGFIGLDSGNADAGSDSLRRTLERFKSYL